jgi:hypothetical protein
VPVFGERKPAPTPTEAYVQRAFADAVAVAADAWRDFVGHGRTLDSEWERTFTLRQKLMAFTAGPIVATLRARFPEIADFADQADDLTEFDGHETVVLKGIIGEGVVATGTHSREEVREGLTGWP